MLEYLRAPVCVYVYVYVYVCVVFSSMFVCASLYVCVCFIMVGFILVYNPGVIHAHIYNQWLFSGLDC